MVLSNFSGSQAQPEPLHPGHLLQRKLPPQKKGGQDPLPQPSLLEGAQHCIELKFPSSATVTPTPHLWKALISLPFALWPHQHPGSLWH